MTTRLLAVLLAMLARFLAALLRLLALVRLLLSLLALAIATGLAAAAYSVARGGSIGSGSDSFGPFSSFGGGVDIGEGRIGGSFGGGFESSVGGGLDGWGAHSSILIISILFSLRVPNLILFSTFIKGTWRLRKKEKKEKKKKRGQNVALSVPSTIRPFYEKKSHASSA